MPALLLVVEIQLDGFRREDCLDVLAINVDMVALTTVSQLPVGQTERQREIAAFDLLTLARFHDLDAWLEAPVHVCVRTEDEISIGDDSVDLLLLGFEAAFLIS